MADDDYKLGRFKQFLLVTALGIFLIIMFFAIYAVIVWFCNVVSFFGWKTFVHLILGALCGILVSFSAGWSFIGIIKLFEKKRKED